MKTLLTSIGIAFTASMAIGATTTSNPSNPGNQTTVTAPTSSKVPNSTATQETGPNTSRVPFPSNRPAITDPTTTNRLPSESERAQQSLPENVNTPTTPPERY
ncbi:hypothetical protein [Bdellovibrio sp. GT3]|uniref:hypothetical protein n=1 Tax=Bdellovibrio sp. GT3 TaxID=3136282 RepID=UPI0030F31712